MSRASMRCASASLLVMTAVAAATACTPPPDPDETRSVVMVSSAAVTSVIDGDTLVVRTVDGPERLRIIGVDTPEIGRDGAADECYAQEARAFVDEALSGRIVQIYPDSTQDDVDRYGRLLRHVQIDGNQVAEMVIAAGAGVEYTYDAAYAGQEAHLAAQDDAREHRRGLWGACGGRG
ncbi:thermonuclease family protein [Microbacterium sp. NM3R9]|uniref:thermonuclease family protein n=1 Tax=Microbacterium thalli TaxID=3027921 RepID=UPI0023673775|nr:thermonuclease family protein [Microbacterium thalli]MDN8547969.1 thermonuclease family protein [Microbacterium thalli]